MDDGRTRARARRLLGNRISLGAPKGACGVPCERTGPCRDHRNAGARDVPVHPAVFDGTERKPDGVGFVVQPDDAIHHADRGDYLSPYRSGLYGMGLSRATRQDDSGNARNEPASLLGNGHVVLRLGSRSRARLQLRDPQCNVA
jgi:hypothetical protein